MNDNSRIDLTAATVEPDRPASQRQPVDASASWRRNAALVVLAVLAVVLRVAAARGDLMLDEIWSLTMASRADSAWQIVVIPHDNNHILNTLAIYALGPEAEPLALRLPAVAAGCLALWFGCLVARRQFPGAEVPVLILIGTSHVLILFGTEARGYGYLICCTLAAWWALEEFISRRQLRYVGAFALAASLGFLAHLTFFFAYAGFVIYSFLQLRFRHLAWRELVVLHIIPVLTGVLLFFAYVLGMGIGAGTTTPFLVTLLATLSLAAGGPQTGPAAVAAAIAASLVAAWSLVAEFRRNRARAILCFVAIVVAPGIVLAATGHQYVYPRYFIVPILFACVAVGNLLADWFRSGRLRRIMAVLVMSCYVVCNLVPVVRLIASGRAGYSLAMRWIAAHTAGAEVTLASDHDFRNSLVAFYTSNRDAENFSSRGKKLSYIGQQQYPNGGTEWFLRHTFEGDAAPPDSFSDSRGNAYDLVEVFPAGSISGWTWWLYHRK